MSETMSAGVVILGLAGALVVGVVAAGVVITAAADEWRAYRARMDRRPCTCVRCTISPDALVSLDWSRLPRCPRA